MKDQELPESTETRPYEPPCIEESATFESLSLACTFQSTAIPTCDPNQVPGSVTGAMS